MQAPSSKPSAHGENAFRFFPVENFNARGLHRCSVPGVGVTLGARSGLADFWRDRSGHVLVRFASGGRKCAYRCKLRSGEAIPDSLMEDFSEFAFSILHEWGAEDNFEFPPQNNALLGPQEGR